jgi:uncharacterized membrane protein YesL
MQPRIGQDLRTALVDAYVGAIPLITLNLFWFLISLPIVTIFPALAGLYYATNRLGHQRSADRHTIIEGFRAYFWISWRWGLMNVLVVAILMVNIFYYGVANTDLANVARVVLITILLLWIMVQIFTFPLLIEQDDKRLRTALRNSLVILIKRPLFCLGLLILLTVIAVVSTIMGPCWVLISAALCTYLANRATIGSISRITGKPVE